MEKYGVKNYKLIKDYVFDLNKINIAVGENSSGKSSFLRSLQLIKQSIPFSLKKLHTNLNNGIDFGEYFNLVTEGNMEEFIKFEIVFNNIVGTVYGDMILEGVSLEYKQNLLEVINVKLNEGNLIVIFSKENKVSGIKFNGIDLLKEINEEIVIKNIHENCFPILLFKNSLNNTVTFYLENFLDNDLNFQKKSTSDIDLFKFLLRNDIYLNKELKFVLKEENNKKKENIKLLTAINNRKKLIQNELKIMVQQILENTENKLRTEFENIIYIGPIRAIGERYYRIIEEDIDKKYTVINNDVSRKLYNLSVNDSIDKFNKFIRQYFDFDININTLKNNNEEDIFFSIEIDKKGDKKNLLDVGAGYSQLIPIIYTCFGKDRNEQRAIIIIEQPELHLHPKMQSDLIDFILKLSKKNSNLKFVIETHSSLIIDRIGKNVFRKNYNSNDINIFIFNRKEELIIEKTKYNDEGILEKWPIRFFSAKEINKW